MMPMRKLQSPCGMERISADACSPSATLARKRLNLLSNFQAKIPAERPGIFALQCLYMRELLRAVKEHYRTSRRDLPWRRTRDPYRVLVSEVMLQQTQVERVVPYYNKFIKR